MDSFTIAIIVAAGRGERAADGSDAAPKQYQPVAGRALLAHTVEAFVDHARVDRVVVVIGADHASLYRQHVAASDKLCDPVVGGETRQQSVLAGLAAVYEEAGAGSKVLIHDAARPFVSADVIGRVIEAIVPGRGALPASRVADTLKRVDSSDRIIETVPRDELIAAQTPQGFMFDDIHRAHLRAAGESSVFTDDAAIAEWAGLSVVAVDAPGDNLKITTAADLAMARRRLGGPANMPDIRVGNGYDIHSLTPGNGVTLCGVRIDHDRALAGHSDADVGLHALTDALLGTIADGDIGEHFPPADERWRGASSDRFLAHAAERVRHHGGVIGHLDVTVICEAPKIGPHRDAMRASIAAIAGIEPERVSVKATTNERIGAVGRREGIAAIATATVAFSRSIAGDGDDV